SGPSKNSFSPGLSRKKKKPLSANRAPRVMKRILLTTGDRDGVGCEITAKALNQLAIRESHQIFVYCGRDEQSALIRSIQGASRRRPGDLSTAMALASSEGKKVFVIGSKDMPQLWVEEAARSCLRCQAAALVTGPLSKPLIR